MKKTDIHQPQQTQHLHLPLFIHRRLIQVNAIQVCFDKHVRKLWNNVQTNKKSNNRHASINGNRQCTVAELHFLMQLRTSVTVAQHIGTTKRK